MAKNKVNKSKLLYYSIMMGFFTVLLNMFIYLFITPKITNTVGIEAYGFVTLSKNFISYADIVMTALNTFAARYMTIAYTKNEREKYEEYYSTVLFFDLVIGGLLLALGLFFAINVSSFLIVSSTLLNDVRILFIVSFCSFFVKTITTVFMASGFVLDRIDLVNIIKSLAYFAEIFTLLFFFGFRTSGVDKVAVATLISTSIIFVGSVILTKVNIPEAKLKLRKVKIRTFRILCINGIWNSVNSIGNTMNSGLDVLMCNLMLSEHDMGEVSVAKTIGTIVSLVYITVSQPFQPTQLKLFAENKHDELLSNFKKTMLFNGIITNIIFSGFLAMGMDFLKLWIPNENTSSIFILSIIALLPCLSEGCIYPLYYIYTLTVKNKVPCFVTILGGVLNIIGMYILIHFCDWGSYAIVITTAVIMNIINLIVNPLYMSHVLHIKKSTFYPSIFLNLIMVAASSVTCFFVAKLLWSADSWAQLILKAMLIAGLSFLIQWIIQYVLKMVFPNFFRYIKEA